MKVENMTYNAKTAFTERREIIDKLNECINSINTYGPEKIKDLESKNIQQHSDIVNLKTKITDIETKDTYQDSAIAIIERKNEKQDVDINNLKTKITDIETKDTYQDSAIAIIERKNEKQDVDINNLKNADTNNVKINKINEYAVGVTGNQIVSGEKTFVNNIIRKVNHSGGTSPEVYATNLFDCYLMGNDSKMIVSLGHEKSNSADNTRIVFSLFANTNIETGKQPSVQLHFIFDNLNNKFVMRPAHVDENGVKTFGNAIELMTW